jgi:hypothetical protein
VLVGDAGLGTKVETESLARGCSRPLVPMPPTMGTPQVQIRGPLVPLFAAASASSNIASATRKQLALLMTRK